MSATSPQHEGYVDIHITHEDRPVPLCDFCSGRLIVWTYPCASFDLPDWETGSVTDWAACAACAQLIEADARAELRARSIASTPGGVRDTDEYMTMLSFVTDLHAGFFLYRTGPRIPYLGELHPA